MPQQKTKLLKQIGTANQKEYHRLSVGEWQLSSRVPLKFPPWGQSLPQILTTLFKSLTLTLTLVKRWFRCQLC